jgi:PHD/YefM family antitoxin component YafN of YafNO toxin-antitoxin module
MFETSFDGKTVSITVQYDPTALMFEAVILKKGEEGAKSESVHAQDTNAYALFRQIRHASASDVASALVMRRFVQAMGNGLRVLNSSRKSFIQDSRKDFKAIREASKKRREAQKAAKAAEKSKEAKAKKTTSKKATKKVVEKAEVEE